MWYSSSSSTVLPHLRDEDLDLVRLHLVGEHLTEGLAVGVGERPRVHVFAGERVALEVGLAHAGDAQHLELVVLAHPGERDAVVDLGDLVQRAERVLGDEDDAVDHAEGDQAATAGDALPRVVGAVLHHLFRRDVEGHAHSPLPSSRPPYSASARAATVASSTAAYPVASMTATDGKMRRTRSGPPVAVSSSAAANRARSARSTVSSRRHALLPDRLDPVAGVHAARAVGLEVGLLVLAAGDVVAEHPAPLAAVVVAGEQGTTAKPCIAAGRLLRTIWPSWLALPSSESVSPSIFS